MLLTFTSIFFKVAGKLTFRKKKGNCNFIIKKKLYSFLENGNIIQVIVTLKKCNKVPFKITENARNICNA